MISIIKLEKHDYTLYLQMHENANNESSLVLYIKDIK